ncbi:ABC transporter ATP-binding protein [Cryobacterium sp. TmT2-59]|uniref:ABC transporter ATP-binding protein n=1 Tax=Cryobacterium shii TaxID=1259235 RepID=A0AAQ2C860_9MICO|nr:ABC transporter ATP-binding protein [Cryobacterium shii]TFC83747.1 ABC transporter ATP-binding protein [Cryobacterium sp. TmT2-59]
MVAGHDRHHAGLLLHRAPDRIRHLQPSLRGAAPARLVRRRRRPAAGGVGRAGQVLGPEPGPGGVAAVPGRTGHGGRADLRPHGGRIRGRADGRRQHRGGDPHSVGVGLRRRAVLRLRHGRADQPAAARLLPRRAERDLRFPAARIAAVGAAVSVGTASKALRLDIRHRRVRARLDLDLEHPGITVLFGPSGAGKTTIIRCLAGLDRISSGTITLGPTLWDDGGRTFVPARRRNVGYLFQDLALFPHLNVAENVGYGLKRMPRASRQAIIDDALRTAEVPGFQERIVAELSGGEAQRVALARAIAPRPDVLLLDEPLAGLDDPTRLRLRSELRRLILHAGIPALVVTHDRDEALALADQLVVLIDGAVHQTGPPAEVFDRPADAMVARVVGMDTISPARVVSVDRGTVRLRVGEASVVADLPSWRRHPLAAGEAVAVCLRGGDVGLRADPGSAAPPDTNSLPAVVTGIIEEASLIRVQVDAGFPLVCFLTRRELQALGLTGGSRVLVLVHRRSVHLAELAPQ